MINRRTFVGTAIAAGVAPKAAFAQGAKPIRIGVLNDLSSVYADYQGMGSVIAARLAAEDIGSRLGAPVEPATLALRVLADLETALAGEATMPGGRRKSVVFQEQSVLPWLTVEENVAYPLRVRGVSRKVRLEQTRPYLRMIGLEGFATALPHQLSGGMKQRVSVARALSEDADVLLMDEPYSALDPIVRARLQDELLALQERLHKTIVLVTHDIDEAIKLADRVAVFSARPGTIKEVISVDEPHPRKPEFVTTEKFTRLRNTLYTLLHDEIRKAVVAESARTASAAGAVS